VEAEFPVNDPAGGAEEPRQMDVDGHRGAIAVYDPGIAVGQHLFDDQRVAELSRVLPFTGPHAGEPRHGFCHLWARCKETHIHGQWGLPLALLGGGRLRAQRQPKGHRDD